MVSRASKGKRTRYPESMIISVFFCPNLSAKNPDIVPPIAEVTRIPKRMYVFIVSETCHTCSRKIAKLLVAVKMASLNKKYARRKSATLDDEISNFVAAILDCK